MVRWTRSPIEDGMVPLNSPPRYKEVRFTRLPIEDGIVPRNLLPLKFRDSRFTRLPIEGGIVPSNKSKLKSSPVTLVPITVIPNQDATGPVNQLSLKIHLGPF